MWRILGLVALGVGGLGIVLPLLPTTPFVLLAAFLFGKGAPEWRERIERHPVFGPSLQDWSERRAIPRRAKVAALTAMAASVGLAVVLEIPATAITVQVVVLLSVAAYILTRPGAGSG